MAPEVIIICATEDIVFKMISTNQKSYERLKWVTAANADEYKLQINVESAIDKSKFCLCAL